MSAKDTKDAKERAEELVADNRKAGHDYHLLEQFEAGLVLTGTEVKSAREGRVNLRDSYCRLEGAEAFLLGAHFGQYSHSGYSVHDPVRRRKLLLNRAELNKLLGKTTEKGLTIVPGPDVLQEGPRQDCDRARQGQEDLRQTRDDQAARGRSRDARGRENAPGIITDE
jgi:SsrA-binding protein